MLGLSLAKVVYLFSACVAISVCSTAHREHVTYRPILATNCLAHFHHSLMRIDGYSVSGSSYVMNVRCYGTSVSCYAMSVRRYVMGVGC